MIEVKAAMTPWEKVAEGYVQPRKPVAWLLHEPESVFGYWAVYRDEATAQLVHERVARATLIPLYSE